MTKNELLEMALNAGLEFYGQECDDSVLASLSKLANAILERAALECEEFGHNEDRPYDYGYRIRSLKLHTN